MEIEHGWFDIAAHAMTRDCGILLLKPGHENNEIPHKFPLLLSLLACAVSVNMLDIYRYSSLSRD